MTVKTTLLAGDQGTICKALNHWVNSMHLREPRKTLQATAYSGT